MAEILWIITALPAVGLAATASEHVERPREGGRPRIMLGLLAGIMAGGCWIVPLILIRHAMGL